jgi:hypothetical protein
MFVQQLHEQQYSVQEMDSDIVLRVLSYLHIPPPPKKKISLNLLYINP